MGTYRLTRDARRDLSAIRGFTIREWGEKQSRKYLAELRKTLVLLSGNPLIGKRRDDIDVRVYSFPHASHVIYYLLGEKDITVIGVLHGSMVPANHLEARTLAG